MGSVAKLRARLFEVGALAPPERGAVAPAARGATELTPGGSTTPRAPQGQGRKALLLLHLLPLLMLVTSALGGKEVREEEEEEEEEEVTRPEQVGPAGASTCDPRRSEAQLQRGNVDVR